MQQGKRISKQSLQERFTDPAVNFMKAVVEHALNVRLNIRIQGLHKKFKRIIISDSTVFELPMHFQDIYKGSGGGASQAAIKVQYCYDLISGSIVRLLNRGGVESDHSMDIPELSKGDLLIEDLGFFKIERFKHIEQESAYFLSRLRFGRLVFKSKGSEYELFDLLLEERTMQPGEIRQYQVYIDQKEKLPVRLILEKVSPDIAAEKRRKLKTDKQNKRRNLSQKRLRFCNLNAYITNTQEEDLPMKNIRDHYGLRWQIEIIFKAWKSVYKIDQVKSMKRQRFECIHYGLLMLIILSTNILVYYKKLIREINNKELSEFKLFRCLKEILPALSDAVKKKKQLPELLDKIQFMVENTCLKDRKKNKLTPYNIMDIMA
jgi:hypothetical protein